MNLPRAASLTAGHLLDGRIRYAQPEHGFRSGIEPLLLAAAVPARAGDRALEGGTGAGAALLCLHWRVPDLDLGVGVDRNPSLSRIARGNAVANRTRNLSFVTADLASLPLGAGFDHAFANPPYHASAGTRSHDPDRDSAKRATIGLLGQWTVALSAAVRHRGTLSFILPAAVLPEILQALRGCGCGSVAVLPLWPKRDRAAKLLIVQAVKNGRAPLRVLPGLVLHRPDGAFTDEANTILRDGRALSLA